MQLQNILHRELCQVADRFQGQGINNLIHSYGQAVLKKTRFHSHVDFLRTCLKQKVIPKGFQTSYHGVHLSRTLQERAMKANTTHSRRLMRVSLQHFSQQMTDVGTNLVTCRETIATRISQYDMRGIVASIRHLNQRLYSVLHKTKSEKLEKLQPQIAHAEHKTVVTIPSDLPLTDTDRSVLSKGLSFIPTPEPDELQCKEDVRKFFRRI